MEWTINEIISLISTLLDCNHKTEHTLNFAWNKSTDSSNEKQREFGNGHTLIRSSSCRRDLPIAKPVYAK